MFDKRFYLEACTKVAFPFHTSPNYHAVDTLEEYDDLRSTKLDSLMTLLRWHLVSDDNGVYRDLDKVLTAEEQEELDAEYNEDTDIDTIGSHALDRDIPDLMIKGKRKILVYTEFPMMEPLINSVSVVLSFVLILTNFAPGSRYSGCTISRRSY
jgi:hypothetical protein